MSEKAAFIGLGVMGYPMAGHLAKGGHRLTVFNRTAEKARNWVMDYGGTACSTPAEAAEGADFVFICVGNDDDLRQVVSGQQGVFRSMKPGAVVIDHTTASARVARALWEEGNKRGLGFLDAPVSGGQAGAEKGLLSVMVGGEASVFSRAQVLMECYGKTVRLMGTSGAGQLTKMVNQICIAGLVQSLSEGLAFAQKAGLDIPAVIDVISKGAAQSWQMENRAATMTEGAFGFGFAVDWMRKDLSICLEEARRNGAALPVAALVDEYYADIQKMGGGRWDTSSLITRLRHPADKGPPVGQDK